MLITSLPIAKLGYQKGEIIAVGNYGFIKLMLNRYLPELHKKLFV